MKAIRTLGQKDIQRLKKTLENNQILTEILRRGSAFQLSNWYLGAGCVAQTVWNVLHEFDPLRGINDYDLVYFDPTDLSYEGEKRCIERVQSALHDLGVMVDVKNEARVHLWYKKHFGHPIPPYRSREDAIGSWPTTATNIGVRFDQNGNIVCAPFGLADLFSMVVRPKAFAKSPSAYEPSASTKVQ